MGNSQIRPIAAFVLLLFLFPRIGYTQLTIERALCENKEGPTGVPLRDLRFSWELGAKARNKYQTAYQLVISTTAGKLAAGAYDVYHSDIIKSRQSILVAYAGESLRSAQTYFWKVRIWDERHNVSRWSDPQRFTTGLFDHQDWRGAEWIGYEDLPASKRIAPGVHEPLVNTLGDKGIQRSVVPLFRKQFTVDKQVRSALLFITGLGQYELSVNGVKTSHAFLSPGWTYYDKTILYNTYDLTSQLRQGMNVVGVIVGNGFYNINRERYFKLASAFGLPKLICRLAITFADGTSEDIVSDHSWKTSPSPITFSSIYGGEDYDARLEQEHWNTADFNDDRWRPAAIVTPPTGKLVPETDYPVGVLDSFTVRTIKTSVPGKPIYDFGQNASGIVRLRVKGKKGQTVKLIPAELLTPKQLANQSATGSPYYLSYTLKGDGEETWQPKFTYYGFRYVQVELTDSSGSPADTAGLPDVLELTALHTRNSNPYNGSFECSNPLFNRIYALINWAIKSNMQSVLTDCPHREKLSWLEQDYLMGGSVHYNYDVYGLYRKLVHDLEDAQYPQGFVPDIAPEYVVFDGGFLDSPEWGSASVILPWLLYTWYGDKDILKDAYPMMKRYCAYLESKSTGHILSHGLGDWFDYGPRSPGEAQLTPKAVTATAIYYYDVALLAKMARVLGLSNDAHSYDQQAAAIKTSFNRSFFDPVRNVYSTGSQTAMAMPLCVGLVDEANRTPVLAHLVDSIYAHNKALTAGDIGFHFLIKALDDGRASQLIFDMNNRDDVPGYGFQLKKGATALTESWPALENVSNNHLMLGHIMEWFYDGLAGISQQPGSIAFRHILIRPQPVGNLTHTKASFHSPYGWIRTEWTRLNHRLSVTVHIPVNTDARIELPGRGPLIIGSGDYRWTFDTRARRSKSDDITAAADPIHSALSVRAGVTRVARQVLAPTIRMTSTKAQNGAKRNGHTCSDVR